MSGGDNGCGSGLLGVTSNNIPQTEHFGLMLLHLGNVTTICVRACVRASVSACVCVVCVLIIRYSVIKEATIDR